MHPRSLALVALGGVLLEVAGCSVRRVPVRDPAATAAKPYDFQGEAASPPPPQVAPAPASGREAPPNLETPEAARLDAPPVEVQDLPPPEPVGDPEISPAARPATSPPPATGFRVQVFASTDAGATERVRADVAARFTERVSVDYEAPYYKVRVGSCAASDACHDLQERLRAAGFATVWIVPAPAAP